MYKDYKPKYFYGLFIEKVSLLPLILITLVYGIY